MIRRTLRDFVLPLIALTLTTASCDLSSSPYVRIATTTSTENSGLLEVLVPAFEAKSGVRVQVLAVGTGQALELGRNGDVDLVLVHAKSREEEFVAAGHGFDRRDVMWNDFVIVGPANDPAGVRGNTSAPNALREIANAHATFISRGDDSGTHTRELALWSRTGDTPERSEWYLEAGLGMGKCLLLASEKSAYVLADRGTWLSFRDKVDLEVLVEGDECLHNPYGSILVSPERHSIVRHDEAVQFHDFLVSDEARKLIAEYRVAGETLFHPATTVATREAASPGG